MHEVEAKFSTFNKVWYCRRCSQTLTNDKQHRPYEKVDEELRAMAREITASFNRR